MRVNLGAHIFSSFVAAETNTLITFKLLVEDTSAAAESIETFDQMFSTINSGS